MGISDMCLKTGWIQSKHDYNKYKNSKDVDYKKVEVDYTKINVTIDMELWKLQDIAIEHNITMDKYDFNKKPIRKGDKLNKIQEIAQKYNISIKKQGRIKIINKSKNELIKEIDEYEDKIINKIKSKLIKKIINIRKTTKKA